MRNLACLLLRSFVTGCGASKLDREALLNPDNCQSCHPEHYKQWSASMHACAGDDPVFLAMNRRGQRETGGALGDFCVKCHAPMALQEGLTTDGLNLDELPLHFKGVTYYFCHNVVAVAGTHNNPLVLANDDVMRGGISDPTKNVGHRTAYSALYDWARPESSSLCGRCHDVVTPNGFHLERGFEFWDIVTSS